MGMSMGGYATWDLLVRHTDLIAAAIPICGGCDTTKYERLIDKPIYTFHGEADPLVSVAGTREMYRLLQEAGSKKITYVEYPNEGHGIWNKAMRTAGLMDWLYAQSL
jgi:predicted peptidase